MKAVGYKTEKLEDITLDKPKAHGRDILVKVKAISLNPVDTKVRAGTKPEGNDWKVLGWDASGIVEETGPEVTLFKKGDEVFYAGAINRQGTNSEFHLVDERIVGKKPKSLDWANAAALPLTSITAWEALFERLNVNKEVPGAAKAIVIIGAAGGVGSIAVQLARRLTNLIVIGTASRPETQNWVKEMGAHHVVDHSKPLAAQIAALNLGMPSFAFSTTHTGDHVKEIAEFLSPQGRLLLIDDPAVMDVNPFKRKSISVHWELMFTRSLFQTPDIHLQGELLNEVSKMVDEGKIKSTMTKKFDVINAANLEEAHALSKSNRTLGKIVLENF